jgi:phosphate transport system permease protein
MSAISSRPAPRAPLPQNAVGDSVSTSNGTDPEVRRSTGAIRRSDAFGLIGSVIAAVSLAAWLMTQLQAFSGVLPFILVSYLLFLLFYVVVTRFDESALAVRDRLVAVFVHSLAIVLLIALGAVVIFTFVRGSDALFHGNFFITDMSRTGPLDPLTSGGILHAALGTLIMISMALAVSIPLGVATAVYLSEFPGRFARVVRTVVEAMTALPSIVAGLFIYATVILILGFPRSGFAAALAITVMMLPIIIRSADVVLRLVPSGLKEASQALGSSRWRTVWHVVLPTARSGLTTAVILGTARGIGETSPVLLTAGLTTFVNLNPFVGPMISLPLATFTFVRSPEQTMISRGFGSAAVLMLMVLILFAVARLIGGRGPGVLTARQLRRRLAQSRSDDYRFRARELGMRRGRVTPRDEPPAESAAVTPNETKAVES